MKHLKRGERNMFKSDGVKDSERFFEMWAKELEKELSGFWNEFREE